MSTTTLSHLPNELLIEIAKWTVHRHKHQGHAIHSADIAAFSSTSRLFRALALPILFKEIAITSHEQLFSLSQVDTELLALTQQLSIFLDAELFESFKFWGFVRRRAGPPGGLSPYDALAHILSRTNALNTLQIRLAHLTGPQSAWNPIFHESPFAIPLSDALSRSESTTNTNINSNTKTGAIVPFSLPNLHTLHLDGFSNVDRLLKASPNLLKLTLRLSGGYSEHVNTETVKALRLVPHLRELVYTPATLRLEREASMANGAHGHWNFQHDDEATDEEEEGATTISAEEMYQRVELIHQIGLQLPFLTSLDLEARSYNLETKFSAPKEILPNIALMEALTSFRHLRHLSLPSTVLAPSALDSNVGKQAMQAMNATIATEPLSLPTSTSVSVPTPSPSSIPNMMALEGAAKIERELAHTLLISHSSSRSRPRSSSSASKPILPVLETLSFIRPISLDEEDSSEVPTLTAIEYRAPSASTSATLTVSNRVASRGQNDPLPLDMRPARSALMRTLGSIRKVVRTRFSETLKSTSNSFTTAFAPSSSPSLFSLSAEKTQIVGGSDDNTSSSILMKPWTQYEVDLDAALSTASVALATVGGCMIGDSIVRDLIIAGGAAQDGGMAAGVLRYAGPAVMGGMVGGAVMAMPSSR